MPDSYIRLPRTHAEGLDAALRYAKIAEAAPHAQHMPSHIFTRVGYWHKSIASNAAAAKLAKDGKEPDDQLHASDYMVYAYLQLGRDREARALIDDMKTVTGYNAERNTAPFALAASPARYAVERGDWAQAARLEIHPSRFGYVEAIGHFARGVGAARSGSLDVARAEVAKLTELRDKLRETKDAYWSLGRHSSADRLRLGAICGGQVRSRRSTPSALRQTPRTRPRRPPSRRDRSLPHASFMARC